MAEHTPTPWHLVEATEHHGAYIVSEWERTICDLYAMSNPMAASVRNGGTSFPVPFDNMEHNAALIVEAVNNHARLTRENEAMRKALEPFAAVAECDIGSTETDEDIFQPIHNYNRAPRITVGHMRAALSSLKENGNAQA